MALSGRGVEWIGGRLGVLAACFPPSSTEITGESGEDLDGSERTGYICDGYEIRSDVPQ